MQISKKDKQAQYRQALLLLGAATASTIASTAVVHADTETGWDLNTPDGTAANGTSDLVNSESAKNVQATVEKTREKVNDVAKKRLIDAGKNVPAAQKAEVTGGVSVYVDHSELNDALLYAASHGINVLKGHTELQVGDAKQVAKYNHDAHQYYVDKAKEIRTKVDQYDHELKIFRQKQVAMAAKIADANTKMQIMQAAIRQQNKDAKFEQHDVEYDAELVTQHEQELNQYLNTTAAPQANKAIDIYHYTAPVIDSQAKDVPKVPELIYKYYDIRSQAATQSDWINKNDDKIDMINSQKIASEKNESNLAQAVAGQTVGIYTTGQALPADRFNAMNSLDVVTQLPENTQYDEVLSNARNSFNWITTYDARTRTVRQSATPEYLVQLNLNKNLNKAGAIGGTSNREWTYDIPRIFFKLLKDNTIYQIHSDLIVNNEYQHTGADIRLRTVQADPTLVNTDVNYHDISNKTTLSGSINNVLTTWDFDQYRNVNVDKDARAAGLALLVDYEDKVVVPTGTIQILTTNANKALFKAVLPKDVKVGMTGHFVKCDDHVDQKGQANDQTLTNLTWTIVDQKTAPKILQSKIKGQALMINAKDVAEMVKESHGQLDKTKIADIYNDFVRTGCSLNLITPMKVLKLAANDKGDLEYQTKAYQVDFGNVYETNSVKNKVMKLTTKAGAVNMLTDTEDTTNQAEDPKQIQIVKHGNTFEYYLAGVSLNHELADSVRDYRVKNTYDTVNDDYRGNFRVIAVKPIFFMDKSTLSMRYPNGLGAGSDISDYFTQSMQKVKGKDQAEICLTAHNDFLSQIDYAKTDFHLATFLTMVRKTAADEVHNHFSESVNGTDYDAGDTFTKSSANAMDVLTNELQRLHYELEHFERPIAPAKVFKPIKVKKAEKLPRTFIDALLRDLAAKDKKATACLHIYNQAVKTKADAINYARAYGITAEQIEQIDNQQNEFIVRYHRQAKVAKQKRVTTTDDVYSCDLYNVKDQSEVNARLAALGIKIENVVKSDLADGHAHLILKR